MPLTHKYMTAHFPGLVQALQTRLNYTYGRKPSLLVINDAINTSIEYFRYFSFYLSVFPRQYRKVYK